MERKSELILEVPIAGYRIVRQHLIRNDGSYPREYDAVYVIETRKTDALGDRIWVERLSVRSSDTNNGDVVWELCRQIAQMKHQLSQMALQMKENQE